MAAKAAHNETIDALIAPVTALIARINDCGASHMARTDAKGVLERFVQRLNFCVRTVPRRRGGRGAWLMEAEQGRLDGFFGSMRQAAVEGVKVESGLADGVELEGKEEIKKENEIKEERGV